MKQDLSVRELLEESEDKLFQRLIDEQEGYLGIEEARRLGGPPQSELARWTAELDKLNTPSGQGACRRRWIRIAVVAAIFLALLAATVLAAHIHLLNFAEAVQEQFTQFSPGKTPESIAAGWSGAYLPSYVPTGYLMSDAVDNGDTRAVEYANSGGVRFTFYQSGGDTNIRIDTETAQKTEGRIGGTYGYFVRKDGLSSLYWNTAEAAFSIVYDDALIPDAEVLQIAESVTIIEIEGEIDP